MIKLASDENFDGDIVRGLLRRVPELDLLRVQDADLAGSPDPVILAWAASEERILLTHDRDTMQTLSTSASALENPCPAFFSSAIACPRAKPSRNCSGRCIASQQRSARTRSSTFRSDLL